MYEQHLLGRTYQEIGDKFGFTRQRAHQICKGIEGYEKALGRRRVLLIAKDEDSLDNVR